MKRRKRDELEEYVDSKIDGEELRFEDLKVDPRIYEEGSREHHKSKTWVRKASIVTASCVIGFIVLLVISPFTKFEKRDVLYSAHRVHGSFDQKSLEALNEVEKPMLESSDEAVYKCSLPEEYIVAQNDFAYQIYKGVNWKAGDTGVISPVSLYRLLDNLSLCSDDASTLSLLSGALGGSWLREFNRTHFYRGLNWLSGENGNEMRDAIFLDRDFGEVSPNFLSDMTKNYIQAYALDFENENDVSALLSWMQGNSLDPDLFSGDDLPKFDTDTAFFLANVFNFNVRWGSVFKTEDNEVAPFYLSNGEEKDVTYMNHLVLDVKLYDYGSYVSAYDRYYGGGTIQYLIPKSVNENILDLLSDEGRNFLIEDGTKEYIPEQGDGWMETVLKIDYSVPKFESIAKVDMKEVLTRMGLGDLFDWKKVRFNRPFGDRGASISVETAKQINHISFREDGTTATSLSFFSMAAGAPAPAETDLWKVELNQPYVYVIRDGRGVPLYIGYNGSGD